MSEHRTICLPNGCTLYWKTNEAGGRTYTSDEIGCGVIVWDTALVDLSTLMAAVTNELALQYTEQVKEKKIVKTKEDNRDHPPDCLGDCCVYVRNGQVYYRDGRLIPKRNGE